jgi:Flp pilus assembly protein TadD/lysophospholipase L1-like esterase
MPGPHRRTTRFRPAWARPALAACATVLSLLVGEGIVRLVGAAPEVKPIPLGSETCVYRRSTNPVLAFELKPDFRHDSPDLIQNYERTNAHGLRDQERTLEKPPGIRRILLLGDSVVEGYKLRENETISRQLESRYSDRRTEVLNFGVSAYCTRAEVELLRTKGLDFSPDVVVLLFVENDFDNFNREAFPLGGTVQRPALVEDLFLRSHLCRLACLRGNLFHFAAEADPVAWNQQAIGDNNVAEGLRLLRQLADQHAFQPLIAIWPRFQDDAIVDVHFAPGGGADDRQLVVEQLAASEQIPSVRLSEYFRRYAAQRSGAVNPRLAFTSGDGLHPSPDGAAAAADALYDVLQRLDGGQLAVARDVTPGDRQSALAAARTLGDTAPSYARVYDRLGIELMKEGRLREAATQFRRALDEDPDYVGAHNNLGVVYERLGKPEARAHFQRAVELEPGFANAHFNLARALLRDGEGEAALAELERTVQLDPRHTGALNRLGTELGKRGQLDRAGHYLQLAVEVDPDDADTQNNLGVIFLAQGDVAQARQQFQAAVRIDPGHQRARQNLRRLKPWQP